MTSIRRSRF
uniref:Uncharacterized protein n=1 Tax=Arundo donax TaxID=35708 RepID=A0A0A9GUW8_ARUDO